MKRAAIFLHAERAEAAVTGTWLAGVLAQRGIEVIASPPDAARIGNDAVISTDQGDTPDLVFVLGGDGTLLRAAEIFGPTGAPLLGVNFGRLGFLSQLERGELEDGIRRVLDDGFDVEERMLLRAVVDGKEPRILTALNDVIVAKTAIGRAIRLRVAVDDEPVVSWAADGVIVASATGSTAYSFSAGGPVVSPHLRCLIVTPVAPHGVMDRSLIVTPDEQVSITVLPDPDAAALSADGGPGLPLSSGSVVRISAAEERVRLAKVDPAPFWALVRNKFRLGAEDR